MLNYPHHCLLLLETVADPEVCHTEVLIVTKEILIDCRKAQQSEGFLFLGGERFDIRHCTVNTLEEN